MNHEWTIPQTFTESPKKHYINDCCVGGDAILNRLKHYIATEMRVAENLIEIYQEDWGWALEFSEKDVVYLLGVSKTEETANNQTLFTALTEAVRREKGLFFYKSAVADAELREFSEVVSKAAEKNGFKSH